MGSVCKTFVIRDRTRPHKFIFVYLYVLSEQVVQQNNALRNCQSFRPSRTARLLSNARITPSRPLAIIQDT